MDVTPKKKKLESFEREIAEINAFCADNTRQI